MKNPLLRFFRAASAFTLIEMLVVIGIIAILASLLLPAISRARGKAQIRQALIDMKNLETAITAYKGEYHRFPCEPAAANGGKPDFTFGTTSVAGFTTPPLVNAGPGFEACNSNVVNVVRDMDLPPNLPNHALNPRQINFLSGIKPVSVNVAVNPPGVDPTGVYRDPWGNPYFITLDVNYDGFCLDAFYRRSLVSQIPPAQLPGNGPQGFYGLFNSTNPNGNGNFYALRAEVMIWSAGLDGNFSFNTKADTEPNKDNVLSWHP